MALKISEIGTELTSIIDKTFVEVSEKNGTSYTTKKYDLKRLSDSIITLAESINNLSNAINNLAAEQVSYNGTTSGLTATNVQNAIDELKSLIT